jgi:hypothetical protein
MRIYYEESWLGYVDSITGYVERACRASLCWSGEAPVSANRSRCPTTSKGCSQLVFLESYREGVWRKRQDLPSLFYCRILWLTAVIEPPKTPKV